MAKSTRKPKPPNLRIGEGDYTEARKAWKTSLTLEELLEEYEKHGMSEMIASVERAQRAKRREKAQRHTGGSNSQAKRKKAS
jgi:hypothetical protein